MENIEQELKKCKEKLEKLEKRNKEQEDFLLSQFKMFVVSDTIGAIAHQWRQPLSLLSTILINIEDAYEYNELTKEYLFKELKSAEDTIESMSDTIDEFRSFFLLNSQKERFNIYESVTDAIKLIQTQFKNRDISINLKIESELVDIDSIDLDRELLIYGYKLEFKQIILNLLTNSKEAIERSKNQKNSLIEINIIEREKDLKIEISDSGDEIVEEVESKIELPYLNTTENRAGVGLYMSKIFIERNLGGKIFFSKNGKERFTVEFSR